jgi:adenine-specific DNA methylase
VPEFLATSRALTQAAHESLGGAPGTRPLVVDPFAGGGSIPLEALRVGADAFASDLNPVPVLLNKVVLEYIPKYACLPAGRASAPPPEPGKFYIYVLRCKDDSLYKGQTDNVPRRLKQHEAGEVEWTAPRFPVELVHVETFDSRDEAVEREKYLKSGSGREWLAEKLKPRRLADEVRKWGEWIKREAEKELAEFYPKDADGATPIAYLWARTIQCEGPGCGAEVPLIRSLWIAKKAKRSVALQIVPNPKDKRVDFQIIAKYREGWKDQANPKTAIENPKFDGTVKRGSATCPCCGYTTPIARVRAQFKKRHGGANDAKLLSVVTTKQNETGRFYRLPTERDFQAVKHAAAELEKRKAADRGSLPIVPDEPTPPGGGSGAGRAFNQRAYGMDTFADLFTARQLLALTTLVRLVRDAGDKVRSQYNEPSYGDAVQSLLSLLPGKQADLGNSLCAWEPNAECPRHLFGRQAISIVWDFAEGVPIGESSGAWEVLVRNTNNTLEASGSDWLVGTAQRADAAHHPLLSDMAAALFTDPPYYDAVPYSDLSDFFFVWFKRLIPGFGDGALVTPKNEECIVDEVKGKDAAYFVRTMEQALKEARRVVAPNGIGVVVFAHKSTSGWEAQLEAMLTAGWIVTASWPVDTECGSRLRAMDSAALASSVHLVCRPRENPDGSVRLPAGRQGTDEIGDWRDVLQALPIRIHEWMPRLAEEGVVGADAIFACLGPALEIFSRYSRVEKASGETVTLKEYLEQVWAAVAKEALTMIFTGADTTGFEEDARLTAMWLWTLNAGADAGADAGSGEGEEDADDEDSGGKKAGKAKGGFVLEYDAARKIAQGLGAHLEDLSSLVEVSGEQARLLPVGERAQHLFGKNDATLAGQNVKRKKRDAQMDMFKVLGDADAQGSTTFGETKVERHGATVLDRIHQSMILFAAGRSEALKRFLVEDGAGRDQRFWRLAQALSALYPLATEEKRWVDGVLARKKGLGF